MKFKNICGERPEEYNKDASIEEKIVFLKKNDRKFSQESLKNLLAEGQAEDYNQYKQIVGTLSGIEWAYTELNRIVNNRMENDLDND